MTKNAAVPDVSTEAAGLDWGSIEFTSDVRSINCETSDNKIKISSSGKKTAGWARNASVKQEVTLDLKDGKIVKSNINYRSGGSLFWGVRGKKEASVCLHD